MPELAVVLVTWNVRDLAVNAVSSLLADVQEQGPDTTVYVVDCASTDGTPDALASGFPQIHVTASAENLGFAGGNNLGLKQIGFGTKSSSALPQAVYLLNPDTITSAGATRRLYQTLMSQPDVGLVGAQLAYGDGSFQHAAFGFPGLRQLWTEFFPTPGRLIEGRFNGRYPRSSYAAGQPFAVDCVLGATMMLRSEVIEQTGMFDEQFFMYCEEIDWAWRIHKAGWKILCEPTAHVVHLGGQSTGQIRPQSAINLWTSRLRLFRKHYPAWKYALAKQMIIAGMADKLRSTALSAELKHAYQTIIRLAQDS